MMSKERQRAELHKTIWRIANDLRGSVDGWDFKTYVLGMLFYRYISENLVAYLNEMERSAGDPDFDYAALSDAEAEAGRAATVEEKGFYILPSELFANVRSCANRDEQFKANLNEALAAVFRHIEGSALGSDSEDDLKGLFDDLDVNSSKLGNTVARRNEKLTRLLNAYVERVTEWDYAQKRELLHRLGARVTVEKQGVGQARFWVDVNPPWPEGTAWWDGLFGGRANGPFGTVGEKPAETSVSGMLQ